MGRLSNFELLRIVAMVSIVYYHSSCHARWPFNEHPKGTDGKEIEFEPSGKIRLLFFYNTLGQVGVQLFVIISGYFLATRGAKLSSILRTWYRVFFWSATLSAVEWLVYGGTLTTNFIIDAALPVLTHRYWFASVFVYIMMLTPALAIMIKGMNARQHAGLILIIFSGECLSGLWGKMGVLHGELSSHPMWFICLYLIGAFVKVHEEELAKIRTKSWAIATASAIAFDVLYVFCVKKRDTLYISGPTAVIPLSISVTLTVLMSRSKMESATIDWFAAMTFSVYLIHEHPAVRPRIWNDWPHLGQRFFTWEFYPMVIFYPGFVYLVCTFLEWIRQVVSSRVEDFVCKGLEVLISAVGSYIAGKLGLVDENKETFLLQEELA